MDSKITFTIATFLLTSISPQLAWAQQCTPLDVSSPSYSVDRQANVFEAAKQAADYAKQSGDEDAARIAAEVALQIGADTADIALIIGEIADSLHLSTGEIDQVVSQVATMTCSNEGELTNLVRRTLDAYRQGRIPRSFSDDVEPVDSDNPNITGPGRPLSGN